MDLRAMEAVTFAGNDAGFHQQTRIDKTVRWDGYRITSAARQHGGGGG